MSFDDHLPATSRGAGRSVKGKAERGGSWENRDVQYRILGPLEVEESGRLLDLGRRKQRAVLAALIIEANRVVSVDRLIDELWGEEAPAQAAASLQAYVSNLRRVLEPGRQPRERAQMLVTQPPGYVLRVPPRDIDSVRFAVLAEEGRRLLEEGDPAAGRERLGEGLSLWCGPALADFAGERFAQVEAARLEELRLAAIEDRLQADVDLGAHAAAVADLEHLVSQHPLRERLWALLMAALYRSGRQGHALRAYQEARRVLGEELGIEPSPVLRQLEADILAQASSLEWRRPQETRPFTVRPRAPAGPSNASWRNNTPFVGRDRELGRLRESLEAASAGHGRVALVHGEAGIGKTRIAQELVIEGRARGFESAWGRAYEGGSTPAFWPWVEVIRSLLTSSDRQLLVEAAGQGAPELAQIVPEAKALLGSNDPPPPVDPGTARFRLFEAVSNFLRRLARPRPIIVVLDDLQWADVASLELLSFLGSRLPDASLLVVGTYRPGEVGAGHPLSDALAALARHQVVGRLALTGLREPEVEALVLATTGAHAGPSVVATVHARTGGNPFFVVELARLLHVERSLDPEAVARRVPAAVRDVVRRRIARLPEQATALLSLAAVAGREFDLDVLEAAADLDADPVLELVESALVSGLVVEDPDVVGRFRFSHDLVRETIVEELTSLRRARLHGRLAEAVEALHGGDDERAVEVAHHFFQAGSVGRPEKAVEYALRASVVASARLAYEQAYDLLRRALDVARTLPPGRDRDRRELAVLLPLSSLVTMTKGFAAAEAHELLARALALCQHLGESHEIVPVLWRLVSFHNVSGQLETAQALGHQLLEVATRSAQPAELVAAHHSAGVTALQRGRLADARLHLEGALALSDGLHDHWLISWFPQHPVVACSTFLAWTHALLDEPRRALDLAEEALAFAERVGHDFTTVHALLFAAWMTAWAGEAPSARRRAEEAVEFADAKGFGLYGGLARAFLGWVRSEQGDPRTGSTEIDDGLAMMEGTGAWMLHTFFLGLRGEAEWAAGQAERALASVEEALRLVKTTGEAFYQPELHRLRGELLLVLASGDLADIERELRTALALAREQGSTMLERRALDSLRRLAARTAGSG
jgi:DNA-binding SARP family transcriptional activator/predicted ATPase